MHFIHIVFANNDEVNVDRFTEEIGADYCEIKEKFNIEKLNWKEFIKWMEYAENDAYKLIREAKEKGKRLICFLDCHI